MSPCATNSRTISSSFSGDTPCRYHGISSWPRSPPLRFSYPPFCRRAAATNNEKQRQKEGKNSNLLTLRDGKKTDSAARRKNRFLSHLKNHDLWSAVHFIFFLLIPIVLSRSSLACSDIWNVSLDKSQTRSHSITNLGREKTIVFNDVTSVRSSLRNALCSLRTDITRRRSPFKLFSRTHHVLCVIKQVHKTSIHPWMSHTCRLPHFSNDSFELCHRNKSFLFTLFVYEYINSRGKLVGKRKGLLFMTLWRR